MTVHYTSYIFGSASFYFVAPSRKLRILAVHGAGRFPILGHTVGYTKHPCNILMVNKQV